MRFTNLNKDVVSTLNKEEARALVKFLESECLRHERDIAEAQELIRFAMETKLS